VVRNYDTGELSFFFFLEGRELRAMPSEAREGNKKVDLLKRWWRVMRPQDIVIGQSYRLIDSPRYGYAKAVRVLKGKQNPNTKTYSVVECEHTVYKDDVFGFKRYFRPCDLIKEQSNG
jgi:hypothetical protein